MTSSSHLIEYSKSSKARCSGSQPCKGSTIELGTLRYGQAVEREYGTRLEWRHWGCITPEILGEIGTGVDKMAGFATLRPEDQAKVRLAVGLRRVARADVPESAKTTDSGTPSQRKRREAQEAASLSQPTTPASGSQRALAASHSTQMLASQAGPSSSQTGPSASQSFDNEEQEPDVGEKVAPVDELYCTLNSSVVGIQYYRGMVATGEQVNLVREPHNRYDSNAIQVKNIASTQVGHIPRNVATKLAPLMDRNAITVEGIMSEGNLGGNGYDLKMKIKIYGPSDKRALLEPLLIWATPGQRGFNTAPAASAASRGLVGSGSSASAASARAFQSQSGYGASGSGAGYGAGAAYGASQAGGYGASQSSYGASSSQAARAIIPIVQTPAQIEAAQKRQAAMVKAQEALAKAAELRDILNTLEKVSDEGRRGSLLDSVCPKDDVLNLPLHPNPPGKKTGELEVDLLKHQSQALQWCLEHEYPVLPNKEEDKPVQFWQLRKNGSKKYYFNIATNTPTETPPVLGRGALCGDSMGLGKTLTMLSLIITTKKEAPLGSFSKSTLIACPVSVMSNWEKQIKDHCTYGTLSVALYYDKGRNMTAKDLARYDVVITSYGTITTEHSGEVATKDEADGTTSKKKKAGKTLFQVQWKRIILDEGHTIRNPTTKVAKACCGLTAERRWVLSGTPILNGPRDLGSIVTFLRICAPLDNGEMFNRLLMRPLKAGDPSGAELLRALMSHICIRRTKEMQDAEGNYLVPLPAVEITLVPVSLHPEARELYDRVEEISKNRVESLLNGDGNSPMVQANVLSMLTRLRQLALHPGLVPKDYLDQLLAAHASTIDPQNQAVKKVSPKEKIRLQAILAKAIEDFEECPICMESLNAEQPRITSCAHCFCLPCITEVISRDPKCPMDRRPIGLGDLIEPPPPTEATQVRVPVVEEEEEGIRTGSSAKIDQLVHLLKLTPAGEKSLVFSQFTSFLDKIAETFEEEVISYVRFDGQMSAKKRTETLARFSVPLDEDAMDDEEPSVRRTKAKVKPRASTGSKGNLAPFPLDDDESEDEIPARSSFGKGKAKAAPFPLADESDDDIPVRSSPSKAKPAPFPMGEDDESEDEIPVGPRKPARSKVIVIDDSEDDELPVQTSRKRKRPAQKSHTIIDSSDGEYAVEIVEEEEDVVDDDAFLDDSDDEIALKKRAKAKRMERAKPKAEPRTSAGREAYGEGNPKVMLISLKAGALGLNLTVANNVYLLDPWWQEGIESQAIDRCNRIGQTKPVHVFQLISENTVESKVLDIQEKKKTLIKHAFSGIKRKETIREKKEARLKDLVTLFGIRSQVAASQVMHG